MLVRFENIEWDTSNDSDEFDNDEPIDLPTTVEREVDDDLDVENDGADWLSDEFGFCVFGFDYKVLS